MQTIVVDPNTMICPHFANILYSSSLNKVFKGGRGSTKSSVISLQLVMDFLKDEYANVLIMLLSFSSITFS